MRERKRRGTGTVYRRADGRWLGAWDIRAPTGGKRTRRTVSSATYCGALRRFSDAVPYDPTRSEDLARGSRKEALAAARVIGTHTERDWFAYGISVGWCCEYCGRKCSRRPTKDHRVPISRGGSDGVDNLAVACKSCNSRKGDLTESEYRSLFQVAV